MGMYKLTYVYIVKIMVIVYFITILFFRGTVKIAEVSSRFTDVNNFIKLVTKYGYKLLSKNLSHDMFYFMDFKKVSVPNKSKVPIIELKSCMYKKR